MAFLSREVIMSKDEHDPHEIREPPAEGGEDEVHREPENGVAASAPVPWLEPAKRRRRGVFLPVPDHSSWRSRT